MSCTARAMQLNPPWQACDTPWHGQRTGSDTLQTFIEGDAACCAPGGLPGQQLLPGEETPRGQDTATTTCLLSPSLAGTWSLVQGRNPGRTESCDGNHTQHFPVIQDNSPPPPQLGGTRGSTVPAPSAYPASWESLFRRARAPSTVINLSRSKWRRKTCP